MLCNKKTPHTHTHTYTQKHTHTHTDTYTNTHTYTHTHTQTHIALTNSRSQLFFRRKLKHKHRENNKRNSEIESPASSGGQGHYTIFGSCPWPPLEAAMSIFNVGFFFKKNNFRIEINKPHSVCHQCRNVSFTKTPLCKITFAVNLHKSHK